MKDSYNKSIQLRCIVCGDTDFEMNEDKTWIKCSRCAKEYTGGYDELVELNQGNISSEFEKMKNELATDAKKEITDMLKNAFKGNKNIRFKG
jgi:ribosomal protein L37AE/L43A